MKQNHMIVYLNEITGKYYFIYFRLGWGPL